MVRVLVVDDSSVVRQILSRGLSLDPQIEVVGTASDPYKARDLILQLKPDVLTLDVEMPRMDGLEFLRRLMPQYPIPIIMVSALTKKGSQITLEALSYGAIDFVMKPKTDLSHGLALMMDDLRKKVKMAAAVDVSKWKKNGKTLKTTKLIANRTLSASTDKVIGIGASTGGTEAIRKVLTALTPDTPGVVIVQHMPAGFTSMFANRLNELCSLEVKEAENGDQVIRGRVLIAPGDYQMHLVRSGGNYYVECTKSDLVCGHRPSVEVLFKSMAKYAGSNSIGIMLTGMGHDGANGMVEMRRVGAKTIAQDEATSIVFGMPKEAYIRGGAEKLVPLYAIPQTIQEYLRLMQ